MATSVSAESQTCICLPVVNVYLAVRGATRVHGNTQWRGNGFINVRETAFHCAASFSLPTRLSDNEFNAFSSVVSECRSVNIVHLFVLHSKCHTLTLDDDGDCNMILV